jgi:hypothetical protein
MVNGILLRAYFQFFVCLFGSLTNNKPACAVLYSQSEWGYLLGARMFRPIPRSIALFGAKSERILMILSPLLGSLP